MSNGHGSMTPRGSRDPRPSDPLPSRGLALLSLGLGAWGFGGELAGHNLGLALVSLSAGIIIAVLLVIRARKYR